MGAPFFSIGLVCSIGRYMLARHNTPNPECHHLCPRIQHIVTNHPSKAWVLKLKIGLTIASYLVTPSEAFAKDNDQFKLLSSQYSSPEEPVSARTNEDEKQMIAVIVETLKSVICGCSCGVFIM